MSETSAASFFFSARSDSYFGASFGKRQRSIAANTLRRAGNQCNFIF